MTESYNFCRETLIDRATSSRDVWDVIVIGGGATGLGTAVDAATRGYRTLLMEQYDFGKGTSSRSTKLVHGGVRYLRQGNLSLVFKALKERGLLLENASHLSRPLEFVVPCFKSWEKMYYGVGLKAYDLMAGRLGLHRTSFLNRDEVLSRISGVEPDGLRGGVSYYDGQFDDARMTLNLAQTCSDNGGIPLNYFQVTRFTRNSGKIDGVVARDTETGKEHVFRAKSIINATGVFADRIRSMDDPTQSTMIRPSQGIHLVLDRSFLPGEAALMVPHTDDGRVLFAIPWYDHVLIGTTDIPVEEIEIEPRPRKEEVEYLLAHAARYLAKHPNPTDILSAHAGLRPLVSSDTRDTRSISRDHVLLVSKSGLVTITGGKWTTYRQMAEEAVDQAAAGSGLDAKRSRTKNLKIHGADDSLSSNSRLDRFGSDLESVKRLVDTIPRGTEKIHPRLSCTRGEVVWSVRSEMARTVEDILARRTRALFLDAGASLRAAPVVASIMADELDRDDRWIEEQVRQFTSLAGGFLFTKPTGGDSADSLKTEANPSQSLLIN
jgi:glycerol-3-phosphate dehydrogenase